MTWMFLLIGLALIFLEFLLPGAILGVGGVTLILTGLILEISKASFLLSPLLYFVLSILGAIAVIYLALRFVRRASPSYSLYSDQDQEGYKASEFNTGLIGKIGVAQTDLRPAGRILIDNQSYQAISQSGYLMKGSQIIVIGGQEATLIVKPHFTEKQT